VNTKSHDEPSDRRRLRLLLGLAAVLAIAMAIVWWPRFRQYPAVTSRESLQLMKLLYAACNTRDQARLARVEAGLQRLTEEGKITPAETESFRSIIALTKMGDWKAAQQASLRFAEDQVGVGHPAEPDDGAHDHAPRGHSGYADPADR
jgi:hypothetical protein